ncbi:hypothetical protein D9Q98_001117 [Chlorella vulgaris]|uniref:J domain-containing protein n=1 Tax=Chlorella vulgaris TaxID=3077 RepID=A0A9D4Z2Q2_CHLVU|nr:hypothetical protein D9Q98_001117 [Chlorella vulgaris]
MLANDSQRVPELEQRIEGLRRRALEQDHDLEADRLLRVVAAMLHHSVLKEADELTGPYATALNRLVNQVSGSDWKLAPEGQAAGRGQQEPKFSTWEEVRQKQERRRLGLDDDDSTSGGGSGATHSGGGDKSASSADSAFYALLGVPPSASQADIKTAYRQLALKLHPDVNSDEDAAQRFAAVANAYDTLSDVDARKLYDRYGAEGMKRHTGSSAGTGNAARFWDEFKPHKRTNKRSQARDASTASFSSASSIDEAGSTDGDGRAAESSVDAGGSVSDVDRWAGMPVAGVVCEYPLSQVVMDELQDGRTHGVGLLLGRNCDRGDAKKLPEEVLDICEVEPLRQEEADSDRWIPDELSPSAYVRLGALRPIAVDSFDQRFDRWIITAKLSEGCGGPELGEEIMI